MNTKIKVAALSIMLALSGSAMAGSHMSQHKMEMMKHANPMPNLMQVITKHGDELELTERQDEELAKWRSGHHSAMHDQVKQVVAMEKEITESALAGKSRAFLMTLTNRMLTARRAIASAKIDCRDNLRNILNEEQYQKVISMYSDMMK